MKDHEARLLLQFLDQLGDRLGNDGCNDMLLPDTPENRETVGAAERAAGITEGVQAAHDGRIITHNGILLAHLADLFAEARGLFKGARK